ncbi:STM3941 family protein [Chengkuizengella sediminis]|uniref:STM3941 family protein n=1 Tax=Chengkuizengella sediminis TaxID=1885917 RepID=UPI0013895A80|nr:STM3941 family protein [Chengkuizengella sediminis]NDI33234.1 hypothetical protein [Chengkuizengella sediminis]
MNKDTIEIYPPRKSVVRLFIGTIIINPMGLILAYLVLKSIMDSSTFFEIIMSLLLLIIVLIAIASMPFTYYLKRLNKPSPSLIINNEGIYFDISQIIMGMIKWEEITELSLTPKSKFFGGESSLNIQTNHFNELISNRKFFFKIMLKSEKLLNNNSISLTDKMISMPLEEIMEIILKELKDRNLININEHN